MSHPCPVCSAQSLPFTEQGGYRFYGCQGCGMIFIERAVLDHIDAGQPVVTYDENYWRTEVSSALDRSRGAGLSRLAETILYCRRPVSRFIDIGTGTGVILDSIAHHLPNSQGRFYGVEMFPPPDAERSHSPNYIVGSLADVPGPFDAGMCVEVIEHLTPNMVATLLQQLSKVAADGALFFFNTGLAPYVRNDISYVDPLTRGHICFWTTAAINRLAAPFGLRAIDLPGRQWAFLVEKTNDPQPVPVEHRLHHPLPENVALLVDGKGTDSVLLQLAVEAGHHYLTEALVEERTIWALNLQKELEARTGRAGTAA